MDFREMLKHYINQKVISRGIAHFPQRLLERLFPTKLIIPYYHMISDEKIDHVCNLYSYKGKHEFIKDLDYLLTYYDPTELVDLLSKIDEGGDFSKRSFHLTFDDGFRELHDVVAPILIQKGIPATFFVNSAFTDNNSLGYQQKASILAERVKEGLSDRISRSLRDLVRKKDLGSGDLCSTILSVPYNRKETLDEIAMRMEVEMDTNLKIYKPYLDSSQIRYLIDKGFSLGSHSIDHPQYATIDFGEQVRQTLESTRWVRERYGLRYGAFAFPHHDRDVRDGFFREIRASGQVDISFGTGGMCNPGLSRHLQRCSFEKPRIPADRIVAMEFARKLWKG